MGTRIRASQANRPYLTSQEMRDLVAFLSSGTAGAARTDADLVGEPGDAKRGEQLVTVKGCLQCHSLSRPARGRADSFDDLKGIDSPWSVAAQMWNHSFLMQLETQAQKRSWARLSPAEMADVLAFIQAQMRAH
jgi:mono/diheme cytochrome c family protein